MHARNAFRSDAAFRYFLTGSPTEIPTMFPASTLSTKSTTSTKLTEGFAPYACRAAKIQEIAATC